MIHSSESQVFKEYVALLVHAAQQSERWHWVYKDPWRARQSLSHYGLSVESWRRTDWKPEWNSRSDAVSSGAESSPGAALVQSAPVSHSQGGSSATEKLVTEAVTCQAALVAAVSGSSLAAPQTSQLGNVHAQSSTSSRRAASSAHQLYSSQPAARASVVERSGTDGQ